MPQEGSIEAMLTEEVKELKKTLRILREDAEMALNGEWDRSDDGFKDQIVLIDSVLD